MDSTERQLQVRSGNSSPSPRPEKSKLLLSSIEITLRTRINSTQTRTTTARLEVLRQAPEKPQDDEQNEQDSNSVEEHPSPQTLRKYRDLARHVKQVSKTNGMTSPERNTIRIQRLRGLVIDEEDNLIGLLFQNIYGAGESMGCDVAEWIMADAWNDSGMDVGKFSAEVYGEIWARRMREFLAANHRSWGMVNLYAVGDVDEEGSVWIVEMGSGGCGGDEIRGFVDGGGERMEKIVEFGREGEDGGVREKL